MDSDEVLAARMRARIIPYLKNRGWVAEPADLAGRPGLAFIDSSGDRRVDLSGDYGYVWTLQKFDDSDRDGVATPRWVDIAEGDGLDLLDQTLKAPRCATCGRPATPGHYSGRGVLCPACSHDAGFRPVRMT